MKAILDTHAFLWWVLDNHRLSKTAHDFIIDPNNTIFLSAVSGWEMAIKWGIGKLTLPGQPDIFVEQQLEINNFTPLPIQMAHGLYAHELPGIHKDPFDRLLIAQSKIERLLLISADSIFQQYPVSLLW
jgi:PIN domain nuclease of toxin-antitoxin system